MSEMIERVAKAAWEKQAHWTEKWDSDDADREAWRVIARAAIEAMREPTPEINSAMRRAFERQEDIWSAGIDAALAGHTALKDQ